MSEVYAFFIHGLANKPEITDLKRIWLDALRMPVEEDEGFDLEMDGVNSPFIYWADLFYPNPVPAANYESISDELSDSLKAPKGITPSNGWIANMRQHYPDAGELYPEPPVSNDLPEYERIPLPGFLIKDIMGEFLREAHDYLFNVDGIRDTIRNRVLTALRETPDTAKRVLIGHSQGTFIAYDVMTAVAECPRIDGFMTFGSPLGLDEVQDHLEWSRDNGFPSRLAGEWINIYDSFDLVARPDPRLANDFRKEGVPVVIDVNEQNWGAWRHSATKYLKGPKLRSYLRRLCAREVS